MKSGMKLLSIIIPVYNVQSYLPATLENVLSQNFKDFELILVDDGSTDDSGKICDAFAERNNRIRVIHQKNAGVSAARNVGVAAASGKYIGFVDSDDLIEPNMFQELLLLAENHSADVVQCCHNRLNEMQSVVLSGKERIIDGKTFAREMFSYTGGDYTNQVALWSKIYRRELFEGIIFPVGQTYEDEQETYKICIKANTLIQIPDELYHYVKRDNSIITGISARKILDKQLSLMDRMIFLPKQLPELEEKCVQSFLGYSENAMCQLYRAGEEAVLCNVIGNVKANWDIVKQSLNKYQKIYYPLLTVDFSRTWILKNDFEPIQKLIRRLHHG